MDPHYVRQGEDMFSIAHHYGIADWRELYDHPANERLKRLRTDPSCLFPGDVVYIPDLESTSYNFSTNQCHQITINRSKIEVKIRVIDGEGNPLTNKPYEFIMGATSKKNSTDGSGMVIEEVSIKQTKATLIVWPYDNNSDDTWTYDLAIGHLDPVEEASGMQARLRGLGLEAGNIDDDFGPKTKSAVSEYQKNNNLNADGKVDSINSNLINQFEGK